MPIFSASRAKLGRTIGRKLGNTRNQRYASADSFDGRDQRRALFFRPQRIVLTDRAEQHESVDAVIDQSGTVRRHAGRSSEKSGANCVVAAGYTPCQSDFVVTGRLQWKASADSRRHRQ
jgi:hypothetical protein